jgi:hypothetical protein
MPVVESSIETVTLYQQGARVTRRFTLETPDGKIPTSVEVARLPLSLVDATVRVKVTDVGGSDAQVVAGNVRVGLWVPPRDAPRDTVDQAALKDVGRKLEQLYARVLQLGWEMDLLRGIPVPDRPAAEAGKPPPPSPMAARLALEHFADEAAQQRLTEVRALRTQVLKLEEDRDAMLEAQRRASSARDVTASDLHKAVHVQLRHTGGSVRHVTCNVEYFVPGARWAPTYQCRMTRDCQQAQLLMRAVVCQASGEDWSGVKLTLSTAAPMSWTELPELSSIRLGRAQPPVTSKAGFRPPPQGALSLFSDFDRDRQRLLQALPPPTSFQPPHLGEVPSLAVSFGSSGSGPKGGGGMAKQRLASRDVEVEMEEASYEADEGVMLADDAEVFADLTPPQATPAKSMKEAASRGMMAPPAPPPPASMPARRPAPAPKAAAPGGPGQAVMETVVFTQLTLGNASNGNGRNRLQPADARAFYLETLQRFEVNVTFDVMHTVHAAEQRARGVASYALPAGTVDVGNAGGSFDFSYRAENAVDVPSDGAFHSVPVESRTGSSSVVYVVVPREDTNVYRHAMVRNPLPAPMLSGPTEVYVAGEYVLSTTLPTVAPKGEFRLGLGVEQAIRCARNTRYNEARSGTKIVATNELIHDIVIDLANNLDRAITCEVRERIPQPGPNAEVVVEEVAVQPAWEAYTQEERRSVLEGGRRWRVEIAANAAVKLSAQYVVKLYANNELQGGNRREA